MILSLLFSVLTLAQSYPEKPFVPVFNVNGERVVRVDCWGIQEKMTTYYLKEAGHPKSFLLQTPIKDLAVMEIEVSLLKSENTLTLSVAPIKTESLEVKTYGTDCGFVLNPHNIYCSVFDGEILER